MRLCQGRSTFEHSLVVCFQRRTGSKLHSEVQPGKDIPTPPTSVSQTDPHTPLAKGCSVTLWGKKLVWYEVTVKCILSLIHWQTVPERRQCQLVSRDLLLERAKSLYCWWWVMWSKEKQSSRVSKSFHQSIYWLQQDLERFLPQGSHLSFQVLVPHHFFSVRPRQSGRHIIPPAKWKPAPTFPNHLEYSLNLSQEELLIKLKSCSSYWESIHTAMIYISMLGLQKNLIGEYILWPRVSEAANGTECPRFLIVSMNQIKRA